eukprot:COSAG01_NODE_37576_length_501_cov_4.666667_1_plen_32_part_10
MQARKLYRYDSLAARNRLAAAVQVRLLGRAPL